MDDPAQFSHPDLTEALVATVRVAFEGSETKHDWYNGLLAAVDGVDAAGASWAPSEGRATIASHVEHVRFTLGVVNGALRGEQREVDWADSWKVRVVDDAGWDALRAALRGEYEALLALAAARPAWRGRGVQMMVNNVAHTAYHASAVRQLARLQEERD